MCTRLKRIWFCLFAGQMISPLEVRQSNITSHNCDKRMRILYFVDHIPLLLRTYN